MDHFLKRDGGSVWMWICLFLMVSLYSIINPVAAATSPNTTIINTVIVRYSADGVHEKTIQDSVSFTTESTTDAHIDFLRIDDSGDAALVPVAKWESPEVGGALRIDELISATGRSWSLPAMLPLLPGTQFSRGEPIVIRVTDYDQNQNSESLEYVTIKVSRPGSQNLETFTLTETAPDSGVFMGGVNTVSKGRSGDGLLNALGGNEIRFEYTDVLNGGHSSGTVEINNVSRIIDSRTGRGVNNVRVTLVDAATHRPAKVFAEDGVTPWLSTQISGQDYTDKRGKIWHMGAGEFIFPFVPPGQYRLQVETPHGYLFPSQITDSDLGLNSGIRIFRGEAFTQANDNPLLQVLIPLDALAHELTITQKADRNQVARGGFVRYTATITNQNIAATLKAPTVSIKLPPGFRLQATSITLDGKQLDGRELQNRGFQYSGREIRLKLDDLTAGQRAELGYVAAVTAGAGLGVAHNSMFATSGSAVSNHSKHSIEVTDDLQTGRVILVGNVRANDCHGKPGQGIGNVRVLLENGISVLTDSRGRWHMEGVPAGSHVVQIDTGTIPAGYQLVSCHEGTAAAGKPSSRIVDVKGGSLWRVDFHLQGRLARKVGKSITVGSKHLAGVSTAKADNGPASGDRDNRRDPLRIYDHKWLDHSRSGFDLLWPPKDYVTVVPSIKIALQNPEGTEIEVRLNDETINSLNFDGMLHSDVSGLTLRRWRGVDILKGKNELVAILKDPQGNELKRITRQVYLSGGAVDATLDEKDSILVADGRQNPIVAVRLTDANHMPLARGAQGQFEIRSDHYRLDASAYPPLRDSLNRPDSALRPYRVGDNGLVKIRLRPTDKSGEVVIRFYMKDRKYRDVRAWLSPGLRNWVMVGLAQASAGYRQVNGNRQTLNDLNIKEGVVSDGKLSFYAQGRIRNDFLLSVGYDSKRKRGEVGPQLEGDANLDRYYTVYGDQALQTHNTPSSGKLYLKLEKKNFYTLFGDARTDLTVTELGRYQRTTHGVHGAYNGKRVSWRAFVNESGTRHQRDVIPGDGTSGRYSLSRQIVPNSEQVLLETRDRFDYNKVISSRVLSPQLDYEIDYDEGSLFLKFVLPSRDLDLNPVQLVVDYESNDDITGSAVAAGGRIAFRQAQGKSEIGLSIIGEGEGGHRGAERRRLQALDWRYHPSKSAEIHAEIAATDSVGDSRRAWLLEASRRSAKIEGKLYARSQQSGFGLGHQSPGEQGIESVGVEGSWKLSRTLRLRGDASSKSSLEGGDFRRQAGLTMVKRHTRGKVIMGIRQIDERKSNETRSSSLIQLGFDQRLMQSRLKLSGRLDKDPVRSSTTAGATDRAALGAEFKLSDINTLLARHERLLGENVEGSTNRVGLRSKLWSGGELNSQLVDAGSRSGNRIFTNLGLRQTAKFSDHLKASFNLHQVSTLSRDSAPVFTGQRGILNDVVGDDYVAVGAGIGYQRDKWRSTLRVEHRGGEILDKWNIRSAVIRSIDHTQSLSGIVRLSHERQTKLAASRARHFVSVGYALRPESGNWTILERIDAESTTAQSGSDKNNSLKWINNLHINRALSDLRQVSLHLAAKQLDERLGIQQNRETTLAAMLEYRQPVAKNWDLGYHLGVLRMIRADNQDTSTGFSVGYSPTPDTRIEVGYNFDGFYDNDFDISDFSYHGVYMKLQYKFDQTSKWARHLFSDSG